MAGRTSAPLSDLSVDKGERPQPGGPVRSGFHRDVCRVLLLCSPGSGLPVLAAPVARSCPGPPLLAESTGCRARTELSESRRPRLRGRRACAGHRASVGAAARVAVAHGCLFDWDIRVSNLSVHGSRPCPGHARCLTNRGWAVDATGWLPTVLAVVARSPRSVYRPACVHADQPWHLRISSFDLRSGAWLGRAARAGSWPALLCLVPCRSPTSIHCGCPPSVPHCRVFATVPG